MPVIDLKEKIARILAEEYRKNPDQLYGFDEEDALKLGVPLALLDTALTEMKDHGFIKRDVIEGMEAWQITLKGLGTLEEAETETARGEQRKGRLDAALARMNEAQEESKKLLVKMEAEQEAILHAVANLQEGEEAPSGLTEYIPSSTIQMLIERAVVQLRGEFIEALEAIKGN